MATPRQVTIVGSDADGYLWTCGHCPASAESPAATRDAALQAFDEHYTTAIGVPNSQWVNGLLTAGQAMADMVTDCSTWDAALTNTPSNVITAWHDPGCVHQP